MELAHTGNDGLACLRIAVSAECGVFFCKLCKSLAHLSLSRFCLGLDSKLNNGLRKFHGLQNNGMAVITNSIAGCGKLKPYGSGNIAGIYFIKLGSLVRVHLQDTSHTFFFIFCGIQYIGTGIHCTGVNSEECQFSYKGVCHNLESQR